MNCDQIEVYLSGYIDDELTQQHHQKVDLHLKSCGRCRELLDQLCLAREATREIQLDQPNSREWSMIESRLFERGARNLGWAILVVWVVITSAYAAFQLAVSPEQLITKVLVFGLFMGLGLLFLSILFERLRESRSDRYRGVLK